MSRRPTPARLDLRRDRKIHIGGRLAPVRRHWSRLRLPLAVVAFRGLRQFAIRRRLDLEPAIAWPTPQRREIGKLVAGYRPLRWARHHGHWHSRPRQTPVTLHHAEGSVATIDDHGNSGPTGYHNRGRVTSRLSGRAKKINNLNNPQERDRPHHDIRPSTPPAVSQAMLKPVLNDTGNWRAFMRYC